MKPTISRRDFLKFSTVLPFLARDWRSLPATQSDQAATPPNFLVLLFDAFSAPHASLHGYPRRTTPNLERIAERAIVYHNHYSASNFTSSGVGSILTGTYPWTHRALQLRGMVDQHLVGNNIFRLLAPKGYTRLGYTHNSLAVNLLYQFIDEIEYFQWPRSFGTIDLEFSDLVFQDDFNIANFAENLMLPNDGTIPGSLFSSLIRAWSTSVQKRDLKVSLEDRYPDGLPFHHGLYFKLEDTLDGLMELVTRIRQPYFAYIHLIPPHAPYRPRIEFKDMFNDGWKPVRKRSNPFSKGHTQRALNRNRRSYDAFIANIDAELGRLVDFLERSGQLDNTYFILTSDHGEMFERGIQAHTTPTLYQPVIRTPLVILKPGQTQRQDIHINTSSVDLLPTVLRLAGLDAPSGSEGEILPPFDGSREDPERVIYSMEAKTNPKQAPLTLASFALLKGKQKLIHYHGYNMDEKQKYEMYQLEDDPEELKNLYLKDKSLARELREMLLSKIDEVNKRTP